MSRVHYTNLGKYAHNGNVQTIPTDYDGYAYTTARECLKYCDVDTWEDAVEMAAKVREAVRRANKRE